LARHVRWLFWQWRESLVIAIAVLLIG